MTVAPAVPGPAVRRERRKRAVFALAVLLGTSAPGAGGEPEWPPVTREARPWTRWWWMGSAVDPAGLTAALEAYAAAGLGGVEITPIYGVRGEEERFVPYLSQPWVALLRQALAEASRRGLGVAQATGTGWPFGGPWVDADRASRRMAHRTFTLRAGERLDVPVQLRETALVRAAGRRATPAEVERLVDPVARNPDLQSLALDQVRFPRLLSLQALMGYSDTGEVVDLTARVGPDGGLDWTAPAGAWPLVAVFAGPHGKMVERAAPGGEGNVIDHFREEALRRYLARFDEAFASQDVSSLRAFFNDSYEVDDAVGQADWTPALFEEFERRRGYDLRRHLPALFGIAGAAEEQAGVLMDYRETVSDLLLERFTTVWRDWAHARGARVRNQAHGSPASVLDLYAASDIPETEGQDLLRIRWASSAAHVAGRPLVSAEAATWLDDHFLSSLDAVRRALDTFFLGGVNHIVYHGTSYTPPGEPWPGWLFYAAVHFHPSNPWWEDFAALNRYVARVQSFLQRGEPDGDVLLYVPLHDAWAERGEGLLVHFGHGTPQPRTRPFDEPARALQARGYAFDFLSDRQLRALTVTAEGALHTGARPYRVLVLPAMRYVPLETFEAVLRLAEAGATVVVAGELPREVAGWREHAARGAALARLRDGLAFSAADGGVRTAARGRGRVLVGQDVDALLAAAGVRREAMADQDVSFTRRRHGTGHDYFVVNTATTTLDGWLPLAVDAGAVALFDPLRGRSGHARVRPRTGGGIEAYVQLAPAGSAILSTAPAPAPASFPYEFAAGDPIAVAGPWTVHFTAGGPVLPADRRLDRLASWTTTGEGGASFSGTARYTATFPRPRGDAARFRLDLGHVRESARVRLNGVDLGTLLSPPFRVTIDGAALRDVNQLEVEVTNLMANRIADLDRRKVPWKKFYNVNFPAFRPENRGEEGLFDASSWPPRESGLLGPVTLVPLRDTHRHFLPQP